MKNVYCMEFLVGQITDLTCVKDIICVFGGDCMGKDVVEEVLDDCAILGDLLVCLTNMSGSGVRTVKVSDKISTIVMKGKVLTEILSQHLRSQQPNLLDSKDRSTWHWALQFERNR